VIDSEPGALRTDFKDQYRSVIAASFAGTGNLARAQVRLSLLGDADPVEALNAQAQRMLAAGDPASAGQVAALASVLESGNTITLPSPAPTAVAVKDATTAPRATSPAPTGTSSIITDTPPQPFESPIAIESTPRPTRTPIPTIGAPFALTGQESLCDANLPDGLLQVVVLNANRRQMPGMEIRITWDGGSEQFFTGLKPELGNGYADFIMSPTVVYSLQLGAGSDVASGVSAPACQTPDGNPYFGGIKLTFQQPD
jgi:hypothetical protein